MIYRFQIFAAAVFVSAEAAPAYVQDQNSVWLTKVRDRYPAASPDGRKLLFESDRSGRNALYLADIDGSNISVLVDGPGEPENGAWCPDGMRIVYLETVGKEFDVFIINADGTNRQNLTNTPYEEAHAHCGRDGRIYFNSDRATPDRSLEWGARNHDLYSMRLDGTDIVRLTDCKAVCTNPNPSPDGTKIAFRLGARTNGLSWAQQPSPMNSEIAVLDLKTRTIRNITNNAAYDTWPSWSPDSKWVVYGSNRDGSPNIGQLFMTSADATRTLRLTTGPASHGEPSFSPDGKTIYFSKSLPETGARTSFLASMSVPER